MFSDYLAFRAAPNFSKFVSAFVYNRSVLEWPLVRVAADHDQLGLPLQLSTHDRLFHCKGHGVICISLLSHQRLDRKSIIVCIDRSHAGAAESDHHKRLSDFQACGIVHVSDSLVTIMTTCLMRASLSYACPPTHAPSCMPIVVRQCHLNVVQQSCVLETRYIVKSIVLQDGHGRLACQREQSGECGITLAVAGLQCIAMHVRNILYITRP